MEDHSFEQWAKGSALVDADGYMRRWYHGTDVTEPFNIFAYYEECSLGFHFGSARAANDRISKITWEPGEVTGTVIPVYCRAMSPLVMDDQIIWDQWSVASSLGALGLLSEDEVEFVADSASAEMLYAVLEEAGFDCVLYTNVCEAREENDVSLMVWRAELVKGVNSAIFDREDPRILSQIAVAERDELMHRSNLEAIEACRSELRAFRDARNIPSA